MRKMTKVAVTLAAMSAMTVASASMAFAAIGEYSSTNVPAEDKAVVGAGKWSGNDESGWSFTPDGGSKLKDTWAEIDGVYYYFEGDKALQDAVRFIDGASYYFDANGTMATGWQKITSKMDAYGDIEVDEKLYYNTANEYVDVNDAYDYEDFVWCYFDEHGVAKENEWFQSPESGLWYYFEGNVMVKNLYNFTIDPDNYDVKDSANTYLYGFDKNGAMLTGWNYKEGSTTWNGPTADAKGKTWYYYTSSGKMQKYGWKQIDGEWYLFADYEKGDTNEHEAKRIGYPLIVNSAVRSEKKAGEAEYFYVDKNGVMQTGVYTIPKNAYEVEFYINNNSELSIDVNYASGAVSKDIVVNLGSNGAAKEDVVGKRYYAISDKVDTDNDGKADTLTTHFDYTSKMEIEKFTNSIVEFKTTVAATGTNAKLFLAEGDKVTLTDSDMFVQAELVKNALISPSEDTVYLADDKGDFVTSKAVLINNNANVVYKNKVSYSNAYILFGSNGKAITGYTGTEKSVTIGGVTYWATDYKFQVANGKDAAKTDITVFVSNKYGTVTDITN